MKRSALIIGGIVIVFVLGYFVSQQDTTVEVDNTTQATKIYETVELEPRVINHNELRIKRAKEAEMERIDTEADSIRQEFVNAELAKIEARVWREISAEAESKAIEKEKESGDY